MIHRRSFLMLAASASHGQAGALDGFAEEYVKLVLAVGVHEPDYVDAYYGKPEWKEAAAKTKRPLGELRESATALAARVESTAIPADEMTALRRRYLLIQTRSAAARIEMLEGKRFSFDEESKNLYDAVAPSIPDAEFERTVADLERLIPGKGLLAGRYEEWQRRFQIPADKLPAVFRAAVDEARTRTLRHIRLPKGESFDIEYVKGQVWSAYNWYKGRSHSLIQVNTDIPVEAGDALQLAAHEGYPGHHVYNALLEDRLVRSRGWIEYSVYPLYSPQSLIAEGTAEHGVEIAFPERDRLEFDRKKTFPLAGLDPASVADYRRVRAAKERLKHAGNQAARRYLDGKIGREECRDYLVRYAMMPPPRADQRVRFIE
jgi:hypothetical protein